MLKKYTPIALAFLLIAFVLYAAYFAVSSIFFAISNSNPTLGSAIVAASATLFAGLGVSILAQYYTKAREIAEAHRPKKVEIYSGFLESIRQMLYGVARGTSKTEDLLTDEAFIESLSKFQNALILWGSPSVINAFMKFRTLPEGDSEDSGRARLLCVDELFRAMRKDLGLSNLGLPPGQLIKSHLKDPNELNSSK